MILGIGTDAIMIQRFNNWHHFNHKQLKRIFSEEEISYSLEAPFFTAQRLAARFAAREALYKAIADQMQKKPLPFLTLCPAVTIHKTEHNKPFFFIHWRLLDAYCDYHLLEKTKIHLTITHTAELAIAFVVVESLANE